MAHEIERIVENGVDVDCFARVGADTWHGLGQLVAPRELADQVTLDQMNRAARLDWQVYAAPAFIAKPDGTPVKVDNCQINVRDRDHKPLGVLTEKYSLIQHTKIAEVLDELVRGGLATWETAGSLREGRRVFYTVRLPIVSQPIPGDAHENFIVAGTSHDGTLLTSFLETSVRVVCANTFAQAMGGRGQRLAIRHAGDVDTLLDDARDVIALTNANIEAYDAAMTQLAGIAMAEKAASRFLEKMIPHPERISDDATDEQAKAYARAMTKVNGIHDRVFDLHSSGKGVREFHTEGTAYGWFNAFTEYTNHHMRTQRAFENRTFGEGAALARKAFTVMTDPHEMAEMLQAA